MPLRPLRTSNQPLRFLRRSTVYMITGLLLASAVGAGTAHAKSWGYDLAAELMSPYCPGRTLASCPSPQAAELVQWMVLQEAAGSTQEEVIAILIERFGEEILGAPPAKGITLWAYIFPVLGFVVGGGLVALALRRIVSGDRALSGAGDTRSSATVAVGRLEDVGGEKSEPAGPALSDDELARMVDADLAARG